MIQASKQNISPAPYQRSLYKEYRNSFRSNIAVDAEVHNVAVDADVHNDAVDADIHNDAVDAEADDESQDDADVHNDAVDAEANDESEDAEVESDEFDDDRDASFIKVS